jgi:hypothetical protein
VSPWVGLWQLTSAVWHPSAPQRRADEPKVAKPEFEFKMRAAFDGAVFVVISADGTAQIEALGQKYALQWTAEGAETCVLKPIVAAKPNEDGPDHPFGDGIRLKRLSDELLQGAPIKADQGTFDDMFKNSFVRRLTSDKPITLEAIQGEWVVDLESSKAAGQAWKEELLESWIKRGHREYEANREAIRAAIAKETPNAQQQFEGSTISLQAANMKLTGPAPDRQTLGTGSLLLAPGGTALMSFAWQSEAKGGGAPISFPVIARGETLIVNPHTERVLVLRRDQPKKP